jgi:hypothetical protein
VAEACGDTTKLIWLSYNETCDRLTELIGERRRAVDWLLGTLLVPGSIRWTCQRLEFEPPFTFETAKRALFAWRGNSLKFDGDDVIHKVILLGRHPQVNLPVIETRTIHAHGVRLCWEDVLGALRGLERAAAPPPPEPRYTAIAGVAATGEVGMLTPKATPATESAVLVIPAASDNEPAAKSEEALPVPTAATRAPSKPLTLRQKMIVAIVRRRYPQGIPESVGIADLHRLIVKQWESECARQKVETSKPPNRDSVARALRQASLLP